MDNRYRVNAQAYFKTFGTLITTRAGEQKLSTLNPYSKVFHPRRPNYIHYTNSLNADNSVRQNYEKFPRSLPIGDRINCRQFVFDMVQEEHTGEESPMVELFSKQKSFNDPCYNSDMDELDNCQIPKESSTSLTVSSSNTPREADKSLDNGGDAIIVPNSCQDSGAIIVRETVSEELPEIGKDKLLLPEEINNVEEEKEKTSTLWDKYMSTSTLLDMGTSTNDQHNKDNNDELDNCKIPKESSITLTVSSANTLRDDNGGDAAIVLHTCQDSGTIIVRKTVSEELPEIGKDNVLLPEKIEEEKEKSSTLWDKFKRTSTLSLSSLKLINDKLRVGQFLEPVLRHPPGRVVVQLEPTRQTNKTKTKVETSQRKTFADVAITVSPADNKANSCAKDNVKMSSGTVLNVPPPAPKIKDGTKKRVFLAKKTK